MPSNPSEIAMDGAFVFLNGLYPKGDNQLARRLIRNRKSRPVLIAVDGGIGFLQKNRLKPDYWISDLDSAPRLRKGFLKGVELLLYPADKTKTDAELALDLCAKKGFNDITVFGWEARKGETDHLLGSLLLGRNLKGRRSRLRLKYLDSRQEILVLKDENRTLSGYKGRRLSILPLSRAIVLSLTGTQYPARRLVIHQGETVALRNQITAARIRITIEGIGLAVIT
jgi:thiamine pyrophosphokinase